MATETRPAPKAPRWITTDAGQRAWDEYDTWRSRAARAMTVQDRAALLEEAEMLVRPRVSAA